MGWVYYGPCYFFLPHASRDSTEAGLGRIRRFVIQFAVTTQVEADKVTDKVSRKATAGKTEGMSTEQLLQMSAVCTDRFSITRFATYSTQGTAMKQNLQTTETNCIYTCVRQHTKYTMHSTLYTVHSNPCAVHNTLYTVPHFFYITHYT